MNTDSAATPASLLFLALSFYHDPLGFQYLRQSGTQSPEDIETILLAAGVKPGAGDYPIPGVSRNELRKAVLFFIE